MQPKPLKLAEIILLAVILGAVLFLFFVRPQAIFGEEGKECGGLSASPYVCAAGYHCSYLAIYDRTDPVGTCARD